MNRVFRRVAVTGIGVVAPMARDSDQFWNNIVSGVSLSRKLEKFSNITLPTRVANFISDNERIEALANLTAETRNMSMFIQFAVASSFEALLKSNISGSCDPERFGVAFGSGIGSIEDATDCHDKISVDQSRRVSPYFVPRLLVNMAAGNVSIKNNLKGPNICPSTACATGAHCIGDAFNLIRFGFADAMVAGSSESCINPEAIIGFSRLRALASGFEDNPQHASRPFDKSRSGFVISEGSAALVLERMDLAEKRGANIIAEIVGYGMSGDAYHVTSPSPDGNGAYRSMQNAISDAGVSANEVDYINAHATSTKLGDEIEASAICRLFFNASLKRQRPLYVSSTKGSTGHMLGASGSAECAIAALSLHHGVIPHTVNLEEPDCYGDICYVKDKPIKTDVQIVLSNSFGFGGTNATIAMKKYSK